MGFNLRDILGIHLKTPFPTFLLCAIAHIQGNLKIYLYLIYFDWCYTNLPC